MEGRTGFLVCLIYFICLMYEGEAALGDACTDYNSCTSTFNAECNGTSSGSVCICSSGYYESENLCIAKLELGGICPTTILLDTEPCLDDNARCTGGKCTCNADYYDSNGANSLRGQCKPKLGLNQKCDSTSVYIDQCSDRNAECRTVPFPYHYYACRCKASYSVSTGQCYPNQGLGGDCNTATAGACSDVNAECIHNTCICNINSYDDNGLTLGGDCRPMSELQVSGLITSSPETSGFNLTWTPPEMSQHVNGYSVQWQPKDNSGGRITYYEFSYTTYFIRIGITAGQAYVVTVVSRNNVTQQGSARTVTSLPKEQAAKPYKPGTIIREAGNFDAEDKLIRVIWNTPAGRVSGYIVKLLEDGTELSSDTFTSAQGDIYYSSMLNGHRYNISITSLSESFVGGDKVQSEVHVEEIKTVVKAPEPPRDVKCAEESEDMIRLTWLPPTLPNGDIIQYHIRVIKPDSTVYSVHKAGSDKTTSDIGGLQPGSYYKFEMTTENELYNSSSKASTADYCTTTARVSDPPSGLAVTGVTSRSVAFEWSDPVNTYSEESLGYLVQVKDGNGNCEGEAIYRCSDCEQSFLLSDLQDLCDNQGPVTEKTSSQLSGKQVYNATGLNPDIQYTVSVAAINIKGKGKTATETQKTAEEVPAKPVITIRDITPTSLIVDWSIADPRPGNTTYQITVDTGSPAQPKSSTVTGFSTRTTMIDGLEENWPYSVSVSARTSVGSRTSDVKSIITLPSAPGKVSQFNVDLVPGGSYNKWKVTWKIPSVLERNSNITSYRFIHNGTAALRDKNLNAQVESHLYAETIGVEPEKFYSVEVYAVNVAGENGESTSYIAESLAGVDLINYKTNGSASFTAKASNSRVVTFSAGIPVFGHKHIWVFISSNGIVSLTDDYKNPTPFKTIEKYSTRTLIAPYFSHIQEGIVYYNIYDIETETDEIGSESISAVEDIVENNGQKAGYTARFVLLVTWERVESYRKKMNKDSDEEATFQLILTTDGVDTFAMFIYGNGLMKWSVEKTPDVWIGYTSGGTHSNTHILSFTNYTARMDKYANTQGIQGLLVYRLTIAGASANNDAILCLDWFNTNKNDDVQATATTLPACPCDLDRLALDPWYKSFSDGNEASNVTCAVMQPSDIFSPSGKTCCYNTTTRTLINDRPHAGTYLKYHPDTHPKMYLKHESRPKRSCCERSQYCHLYYQLRPVGNCSTRSKFALATIWGDPHVITPDGKRYTFNGLGEYVLLRVDTSGLQVELQARTGEAMLDNGTLSTDAAVFTAFAGADNTGARFFAELNINRDGINIYGNGAELTERFRKDESFIYSKDDLIISRLNNTLSVFFASSDLSVNITLGEKLLEMVTVIPTSLKGKTMGLLGTYDGNQTNDFVTPDGTVLDGNMTESEIYDWGQLWEVTQDSSILEYSPGKNHADHQSTDNSPKFLEAVSDEDLANAYNICGGANNVPCVYDYIVTLSLSLAMGTNRTEFTAGEDRREIESFIPSLSGCGEVNVNIGEDVVCTITHDGGNDVAIDFLENNVGAIYDSEEGIVIYKQTTKDPPNLSVVAVNKNNTNKKSPPIKIPVFLCSGCSGHGSCSATKARPDTSEHGFFKYAECECGEGYEGEDCERDFDGCAASPCSHGRACKDLSPNDQRNTNMAFVCAECPPGYVADGIQCTDIDECAENTDGCEHNCDNTDGSYVCTCRIGYRTITSNPSQCNDIDECYEGLHDCRHICDNTPGGYSCSCYDGYSWNETAKACILELSVSPCEATGLDCGETAGCTTDNEGSPICFCDTGYELGSDDLHCEDIDECSRYDDICQATCENTEGGFVCGCYPGYTLDGSNTCKECDPPFWGENCESTCQCSATGTLACHHVYGCQCRDGWQGDTCEEDVDECEANPNICGDVIKECVNVRGSYYCDCQTGYTADNDECVDIDECLDATQHECKQTCSNTEGGYVCGCNEGFTKDGSSSCDDIDECSDNQNVCDQLCDNYPGFYRCSCYYGYILQNDRKSCSPDDFDPCEDLSVNTCSQICVVENNTAKCMCKKGYRLADNRKDCTDINECEETNPCRGSAECVNTPGDYICECPAGKKMENDGQTCTDCDGFHYGVDCAETCRCLKGKCDPERGCICDDGWSGINCDTDIDECKDGTGQCAGENEVCQNIPGSYLCACKPGFNKMNGGCEECSNNRHGPNCKHWCDCEPSRVSSLSQSCDPVTGQCRCKGQWKGNNCQEDVNECSDDDVCPNVNSGCHNLVGGYLCDCILGHGTCVKKPIDIPTQGATEMLTIILGITLSPDMNLNVRATYESIRAEVQTSLLAYLRRFIRGNFVVTVTEIRKGSLVADFVVNLDDPDADTAHLLDAFTELSVDGALDFRNASVTAALDGHYSDRCGLYEYVMGKCDNNFKCVIDGGEAACREKKDDDNFGLILGVSLGCGMFLLVIIGLSVCLRYATLRRRRYGRHKAATDPRSTTDTRPTKVHRRRLPRTQVTDDGAEGFAQRSNTGSSSTSSQPPHQYHIDGRQLGTFVGGSISSEDNTGSWMNLFPQTMSAEAQQGLTKIPRVRLQHNEPTSTATMTPKFLYTEQKSGSSRGEMI